MTHPRSSAEAVPPPPASPKRPPDSRRRRPGVAVLVVLLLLSITLGLSYAAVRSQYTGLQIQRNADRRISARQAAVTGLTMAIKKMHTGSWQGVDTSISGSLGSDETFHVTYTTGDPSLSPEDPDYEDFPYRVTLVSTGYAADPDNPASIATYRIRAVVRLIPRALADEPADWSGMQNYTVYQSKKDPFEVDIPCRLEGPVRVQGKLKIATHYPNAGDPWLRYLGDLDVMRLAGLPDYRPLNGPVDLPFIEQDSQHLFALRNKLGVTAVDAPVKEAASDWTRPTSLSSYQIYDGGPTYTIPIADGILEGVTLEPDPLTNPLGVYYRDTTITVRGNVTVRGSLFCRDDVGIEGSDVHFQPVELPALAGSDSPVRLPAATCRNFFVEPSAGGGLTGMLAVFDRFEIKKSPETVQFAILGRVVTCNFCIKERQPWETLGWGEYYVDFLSQLGGGGSPIVPYFPVWMGYQGRNPKPLLTIKPDPTPVRYHWHNAQNPVYVPHPDDDGLRWDLLEWTESP